MLYELRTYVLKPGGLGPWLKLYEERALPVLSTVDDMRLVGYFRAETGLLNRVMHLWVYSGSQARESALRSLAARTEWTVGFVEAARVYLDSQETTLLSAVPFSPLP